MLSPDETVHDSGMLLSAIPTRAVDDRRTGKNGFFQLKAPTESMDLHDPPY